MTTIASTGLVPSTLAVTRRALLRYVRTPQLIVIGTIQMAGFMLVYRYVFGGAIHTGGIDYVDYLVPGFVTTGVLFAGIGAAVAMAEDLEHGFIDRLRSLPIPRSSVLAARTLADTAILTFSLGVTVAIGFLVGFRLHGSLLDGLAAFGLVVLFGYVFEWVFVTVGLFAGTAQAAQGLGLLVFPLTFLSSAYVPADSMPAGLRDFAAGQPITYMVDAVRDLALGKPAGHALTGALLWSAAILAVAVPLAVVRYRRG
jgi:ABC-2 type transport system permease protein